MTPIRRRELLAAFLGAPFALAMGGCADETVGATPPGDLFGASAEFGHRLRQLQPKAIEAATNELTPIERSVVIVGGGVSGLAAARRLKAGGVADFTLLEMEAEPGGNARSGKSEQTAFPWGAHYVPVPRKDNGPLVELFDDLGAFEGYDGDGNPIAHEHWLVRDPESRLFYKGEWYQGLYLYAGASDADKGQLARFESLIDEWTEWRDREGKRAFAIPVASCSRDAEVLQLDQMTMGDWLRANGLDSPRLHWYVDYACRDDYGLSVESASAWAGVFYFASRRERAGGDSQPFLTWPEGNGFLIRKMCEPHEAQIETGWAVCSIRHRSELGSRTLEVLAMSRQGEFRKYSASRVVFAAPQFLAPYLIPDLPASHRDAIRRFQYGPWAVVNLHLKDRPGGEGFPLCWDNVLYESPGLGYIVATHQSGPEYGPTVLTYYYPLCGKDLNEQRERLLKATREEWAEIAICDLELAHPKLRQLCTRADVARWGHAMVAPLPGFVSSEARLLAARPHRQIHFANSDLSGVSLFEEAFDHGWRAGGEVIEALARAAEDPL